MFPRMPSELYLLPKLSMEVSLEELASLDMGPHPVDTGNVASQLPDKGRKMDFGEADGIEAHSPNDRHNVIAPLLGDIGDP